MICLITYVNLLKYQKSYGFYTKLTHNNILIILMNFIFSKNKISLNFQFKILTDKFKFIILH